MENKKIDFGTFFWKKWRSPKQERIIMATKYSIFLQIKDNDRGT